MNNPWKRSGLHYKARLTVYTSDGQKHVIDKSLSLLSYHAIRLFHGQKILEKMTSDYTKWIESEKVVGFSVHKWADKKPKNPWKRKGWFYRSTSDIYMGNHLIGNITRKIGFIRYHFIKVFRGENELKNRAVVEIINPDDSVNVYSKIRYEGNA